MRGFSGRGLILSFVFILIFSLSSCFESSDKLDNVSNAPGTTGDSENTGYDDAASDDTGDNIIADDTEIKDNQGGTVEPLVINAGNLNNPLDNTATDPDLNPPKGTGKVIPVRMKVEYGSSLGISWFPEFSYDAPASGGEGTVTDLGNGIGFMSMPNDALKVEPLEFIPALVPWTDILPVTEKIRVEINSNDFSGNVDFCTGEANFDFDALFQARMEFIEPFYGMVDEIIVICEMTTGMSTGQSHSLEGTDMDDNGRLTLAGVAVVPKTNDILVNTLLALPTDARVLMKARFDFPEGRIACPDAEPLTDPNVTLALGRQGAIGFKAKNTAVTKIPYVKYDGFDTLLVARVGKVTNGVANVAFNVGSVEIPDIDLSPYPLGIDRFSVKVTSLYGTINFCSGQVNLYGELEYRWQIAGVTVPYTKKVVASVVTTGIDTGRYMSVTGEAVNSYGDGTLVAIEPVQYGVYPLSIVEDTILEIPFNLKVDREMDLCNSK